MARTNNPRSALIVQKGGRDLFFQLQVIYKINLQENNVIFIAENAA